MGERPKREGAAGAAPGRGVDGEAVLLAALAVGFVALTAAVWVWVLPRLGFGV